MNNDSKSDDEKEKPIFTIQLTYSSKNKDIHWSNTCKFRFLKKIIAFILLTTFTGSMVWISVTIVGDYNKRYPPIYNTNVTNSTGALDNNSISFDDIFVPRRNWLAEPPAAKLNTLQTPVSMEIIHHTATETCESLKICILQTRIIQKYHVSSRGWSDIGYNFLIGGDGRIYEGRGWIYQGAHTLGVNNRSLGIAFIGTFTNRVPEKGQINALKVLSDKGIQLGYLAKDYKIFGARQFSATESPGNSFFDVIKTWKLWSEA